MKTVLTACLLVLLASPAFADIRVNLITRMNQYMDDAENVKMTSAQKVLFLDQVGAEIGSMGFYLKRDTIITSAGAELYAANSDFGGSVHSAYVFNNSERTIIRVVPRDTAFSAYKATAATTTFLYIEDESHFGIEPLPEGVDTIILVYAAIPAALSSDSTEWALPDKIEDAAIIIAAGRCMLKMSTAWALQKAQALEQTGWMLIDRFANPNPISKRSEDTNR